jgi:hypothetical protein
MALSREKILELQASENKGFYDLPVSTKNIFSLKHLSFGLDMSANILTPMIQSHISREEACDNHPIAAQLLPINPKVMLPEGSKLDHYEWLKNKVINCGECTKHMRPGK